MAGTANFRGRKRGKFWQTAAGIKRNRRKFRAVPAACICGLVFLCLFKTVSGTPKKEEPSLTAAKETMFCPGGRLLFSASMKLWFPGFSFPGDKAQTGWDYRLAEMIREKSPWYRMIGEDSKGEWGEDPAYHSYRKQQKAAGDYRQLAEKLSESTVLEQSGLLSGDGSPGWNPAAAFSGKEAGTDGQTVSSDGETLIKPLPGELGTTAGQFLFEGAGLPVTGKTYLLEQLADYDYVMKHFYTVHPTAAAGRDMINAPDFLTRDFALEGDSSTPQILIYHSHSQEEFADFHTGNSQATIVGVGEYLAELLRDKGYNVIHDTSVYDLKDGKLDRSQAYTYALEGIEEILRENPSIETVLDIHRDGVAEGTHLVQEINGKPTATIMFFNGTSQTPDGPISYLPNPNREDNLAFSFQLKLCAEAFYPGYTRNIYLKGLRYNLHVRPRSALIEVGAQTNTYEEAKNAMEPLAEILDTVLREKRGVRPGKK